MKWQPIETAPKDGTPFDAWAVNASNLGFGMRFISVWFDQETQKFRSSYSLGPNMVIDAAWELTHWMPLPDPPKQG